MANTGYAALQDAEIAFNGVCGYIAARDPRFAYFRYKPSAQTLTREQHLQIAAEAVAAFDALSK